MERYYPKALKEAVPVPIRQIAENMGLTIIEKELFSDGLDTFGILFLEDGNIQDLLSMWRALRRLLWS